MAGGVTSAILNALVAEDLPGPGTVFLRVNWTFRAPVRPGDTITGFAEILEVRANKPITKLRTTVTGQSRVTPCYTVPMSLGASRTPAWHVATLTVLAIVAFAGNSILCRAALGNQAIDAASFSTLRLLSGSIALWLLHTWRPRTLARRRARWSSAALLFLYAVPFSFAYNNLATGTGALILFGAVQATMVIWALASGEEPHRRQWLGLGAAMAGLVYLVLPGLGAPSLRGSALMGVAGVAWGFYSLRGRGAADPLGETSDNFIRSLPMVALVSLATVAGAHITWSGALLAVASGALASGLGYAVWYTALRDLTATFAATVQLSVPVIAAAGGAIFMREVVTLRLLVASGLILGGVALAISRSREG